MSSRDILPRTARVDKIASSRNRQLHCARSSFDTAPHTVPVTLGSCLGKMAERDPTATTKPLKGILKAPSRSFALHQEQPRHHRPRSIRRRSHEPRKSITEFPKLSLHSVSFPTVRGPGVRRWSSFTYGCQPVQEAHPGFHPKRVPGSDPGAQRRRTLRLYSMPQRPS